MNIDRDINEALELYRGQNFEKALEIYKKKIRENSNNILAHDGAARCLYNLNRFSDATNECYQVLKLEPAFVTAYVLLAQAYDKLKDFDKSREYIRQAYTLAPMHKDVLFVYGYFLLLDNNLVEASSVLEKAVQIDPDSYFAYQNLGIVYLRQQNRKGVLYCAREMKRLRPSFKNSVRFCVAFLNYTRIFNVLFMAFIVLAIVSELMQLWAYFYIAIAFFALLIFLRVYLRE